MGSEASLTSSGLGLKGRFLPLGGRILDNCLAVPFKDGKDDLFLRAYKHIVVSSLVFAYAAFLLIHPDEEGRAFDLIFTHFW
jgi:hypothetical protein